MSISIIDRYHEVVGNIDYIQIIKYLKTRNCISPFQYSMQAPDFVNFYLYCKK